MSGDPLVSLPPSQPASQRPLRRECSHGRENGTRCALPADPITLLCQRHDPAQLEARRAQASLAARASHTRRVTPEMEAWAESLDFTTEDGRARSLTEVAQLVAKEAMTPAQGNAIAALARAAGGKPTPKAPAAPLVVEVERHDSGGPPA